MVDAEQSYLQPAIDALVIQLQQMYNREEPIVFNTYQCYLQDAPCRCALHNLCCHATADLH